jgi:hypothetical protein
VRGTAFLTGKNSFWINPKDPLKNGFILRWKKFEFFIIFFINYDLSNYMED